MSGLAFPPALNVRRQALGVTPSARVKWRRKLAATPDRPVKTRLRQMQYKPGLLDGFLSQDRAQPQ